MSNNIIVGLGEEGRVASKTTRLQPPGGIVHISPELVPQSAVTKNASRVRRPPGGASTIDFSEPTQMSTPRSSKPYRMASNFELGDEQPTAGHDQQNRRRSKPSVNPLTGELIGNFGAGSGVAQSPCSSQITSCASSVCSEEVSSKEGTPSPPPSVVGGDQTPPPRKGRVPPGGFSSPLW